MDAPSRDEVVGRAEHQDRKKGQAEEPKRAEGQHAGKTPHRGRQNTCVSEHQTLVRFLVTAQHKCRRNQQREHRHVAKWDGKER